ncbi:hypothetical protein MASR1M60_15940 [Rhodocyclaceae bacterium]
MNITSENIQLQIANLRGDIISTLIGAVSGENGDQAASFADVLGDKTAALSADGRNMSLFDPESGYQMMSKINQYEVDFKAQFAELDAMGDAIEHMEAVAAHLAESVDTGTANSEITAQLQSFIDQYNAWEDRFDDTVAQGGVLDNIQAAEISLYELEQSVSSLFHGATGPNGGVSGLKDIGITIDPVTKQATLDLNRLNTALTSNKDGVVSAIDEFGAHFAQSADLLNSTGNFIQNALDNRSRAIDYIADNKASLQNEFGRGDAAQSDPVIAKALSAYHTMFGLG